jgi:hypothetical protein
LSLESLSSPVYCFWVRPKPTRVEHLNIKKSLQGKTLYFIMKNRNFTDKKVFITLVPGDSDDDSLVTICDAPQTLNAVVMTF